MFIFVTFLPSRTKIGRRGLDSPPPASGCGLDYVLPNFTFSDPERGVVDTPSKTVSEGLNLSVKMAVDIRFHRFDAPFIKFHIL